MSSQNNIKPYNPFNGKIFDDKRISDLNQEFCNGEISKEEYMRRLLKE